MRSVSRCSRGLSQVEMVILIAVVGILFAVGFGVSQFGLIGGAKEVRMQQEIGVLNSAVKAYVASGGDLEGIKDPNSVISRLKVSLSDENRDLTPGYSGGFLDGRVTLVIQTEEEAAAGQPRLRWDDESQRFVIALEGAPGIKSLALSDTAMIPDGEGMDRRESSMSYAKEDNWIWDYAEAAPSTPSGSSEIPVNTIVGSPPPEVTVPPTNTARDLLAPIFTVGGGNYANSRYPLEISLTNPNPSGSSEIFYSINYASWNRLIPGNKFPVAPDSLVKAQAIPFDNALWNDSPVAQQEYKSLISNLNPPIIDFSANYFSSGITSIDVALANVNPTGTSSLQYQILPVPGGSGPTTPYELYTGGFSVSASLYPEGFGVRAYAQATTSDYNDSPPASRYATEEDGLFSGHLDLDTSTEIAEIGRGSTGAHTHDITGKYGLNTLDFFSLPESKQIEIDEAIADPNQAFKLLVINGDLSPGLSISLRYQKNGTTTSIRVPVNEYDDTSIDTLATFTLNGTRGTARLTGLEISMSKDVLETAGVIPTNTGDVKSNVLGKNSEWRNGSLTVQAVAVSSDGSDNFTTADFLSAGGHGVAQSGMLWEAALFWHWDGDSYHESGNSFKPGEPYLIRDILAKSRD